METRSKIFVTTLVAISLALTASSAVAIGGFPGQGYLRNFNDGHVHGTKCAEIYTDHPEIDGKNLLPTKVFVADASYYGNQFHNRNKMPSGNKMHECDATVVAFNGLPIGTILKATNPTNGISIFLVVQDRGGPEVDTRPDLSRGASEDLRNDDKPAHGTIENVIYEIMVPVK